VLAVFVVAIAGPALGQVSGKKRVAIFDFDKAAGPAGFSSPFFQMNTPNVGKAAADLLITRLVQDGGLTVVERNAIDKLLAEQDLSNTDRTDPLTAAKLGRILGVDAIVLGSITHYDYEDKIVGGGNSRFGFGGGSTKMKHDIKAMVQINARLISPDSGEVLAVSQGVGEVVQKGVKVDMRDTNATAMMISGSGSPVMNEAMDQAIAQLAGELEQRVPKLPPRAPVIDGLIADADPSGRLVLNVGSRHGVKEGDRLLVWRRGKEVLDPASGKVLLRDDSFLGEAVVTTIHEISSIAMYRGAEPVKTGDIVKSPAKHP
jgi:curli biogenesis system outer membrane secretion channel CsgG